MAGSSRGFRAAHFLARRHALLSPLLWDRPRSKAQEQDASQAEWPQSYEVSPQMAVQREATPILSSATVDATQAAIQKYQDIVAKGGWETVPGWP